MWEAAFISNMLCTPLPFRLMGILALPSGCRDAYPNRRAYPVLPALPDEWKDRKIRGMKAGDITVDFEWREGRIQGSPLFFP